MKTNYDGQPWNAAEIRKVENIYKIAPVTILLGIVY